MTVAAGKTSPVMIGPRCLVDYWACDHERYTAGQCRLPKETEEDREEDEANLRFRKMEWEREQQDRSRIAAEVEDEAHAAEFDRAEAERQEAEARAREEAERESGATAAAVLQGFGQILQGMSGMNSGGGSTDATGSTAGPPPAVLSQEPEPVYAPSNSRSQTVTPRNTGSRGGASEGACIDAAPRSGGGGPRC